MASRGGRIGAFAIGVAIVLVGGCVVAATIVFGWGHVAYGLGIATVMIGSVIVIVRAVRNRIVGAIVGAAVAVVIAAGGIIAVTGSAQSIPRWDDADAEGPSGWSATVGGLFIAGGTARDIQTGEIVWEHEGDDAEPLLVSSELVVIGTSDGSVAVETETGRELWTSVITGRGVAHNGNTLVVAHQVSDDIGETVALDLSTGEAVWRQPGRPIMECDLGPTDRYSPAPERSHVLVIPDGEHESRAELLDLSNGSVTVGDVDCSLTARVVGEVLLEAEGDTLAGRSLTDGSRLWSAPIARPWSVEGGGSTIFTPTAPSHETSTDLTAIDVTTGQARRVDPPTGTVAALSVLEARRATEVWLLTDLEPGTGLWNPGSDEIVEVPGAGSLEIEGADVFSGWLALSGTIRDLTGEESHQCWGLSQRGQLYGPIPGSGCAVDEALLRTSDGVYPLQ